MHSKLLRIAALVAAVLLLPISPAYACSCYMGDPRDALAAADGAFIGTFVESHDADPSTPPTTSDDDWIYTFTVDESVKGSFGETIEVHSAMMGASCGLEVGQGSQYGLLLDLRSDGEWSSGLCTQMSPEDLRRAARPLPAPTSDGPIRFVVGGSFGDAQIMALDGLGATVGYGFGGRETTHLDVCPGGRKIAEVTVGDGPPRLVVRRLSDFEIESDVELPFGGAGRPNQRPGGVRCRGPEARKVVVFSSNFAESNGRGFLFEVDGNSHRTLYDGDALAAAFGQGRAFLATGEWGRDIISVDLDTRATGAVADGPRLTVSELSLSPDGGTLAGLSRPRYRYEDAKPHKIFTVELDPGTVRVRAVTTDPDFYGQLTWQGNRRIVLVGQPRSRVYGRRLQQLGTFQLDATSPVVIGERVYGLGWGTLESARLPEGPSTRIRRLPSPVTLALDTIG